MTSSEPEAAPRRTEAAPRRTEPAPRRTEPALPGWLARLDAMARRRPRPSLGRAVAGLGGALVAAGAVTLAGDRWASSGSIGLPVVLTAATLVASAVASVRSTPAVRAGAVAASGISAPALAFFVSAGGGLPSMRQAALLAGLLLAALYLAGPSPGHTFHLAILVGAGWVFAVSLADVRVGATVVGGLGALGDVVTAAGVASMVVGASYVAAGWWLHAAGLEGMATPFLGAGCLALPVGAFVALGGGRDLLSGVVAVAIGAGLALGGGRCRRRGTTWVGVAVAGFGVARAVGSVASGEAVAIALLLAATGTVLVLAAPVAARAAGEAELYEVELHVELDETSPGDKPPAEHAPG